MRGSQAYTTARMVGTGLVFALGAIHLASMPEPQERRAGDAVAVVQPSLVQAAFERACPGTCGERRLGAGGLHASS